MQEYINGVVSYEIISIETNYATKKWFFNNITYIFAIRNNVALFKYVKVHY